MTFLYKRKPILQQKRRKKLNKKMLKKLLLLCEIVCQSMSNNQQTAAKKIGKCNKKTNFISIKLWIGFRTDIEICI